MGKKHARYNVCIAMGVAVSEMLSSRCQPGSAEEIHASGESKISKNIIWQKKTSPVNKNRNGKVKIKAEGRAQHEGLKQQGRCITLNTGAVKLDLHVYLPLESVFLYKIYKKFVPPVLF